MEQSPKLKPQEYIDLLVKLYKEGSPSIIGYTLGDDKYIYISKITFKLMLDKTKWN